LTVRAIAQGEGLPSRRWSVRLYGPRYVFEFDDYAVSLACLAPSGIMKGAAAPMGL
jgi:hypothetical protein